MLRFFTVSRLAMNPNLFFEIGYSFHPEMAFFRNLCVNLWNYLFPPEGGTRNSLISPAQSPGSLT
jgi:hypothetical protein